MDIFIKSIMLVVVMAVEPEDDGSYNYLLERQKSASEYLLQYSIAHSYHEDMGLKEGDTLYIDVDMACKYVWALDPTPYVLLDSFPFGIPRRSYICNAISITIDNKQYLSIQRRIHE